MRACARVALVLVAVSASIGLAACSAIDDLKAAVSRWFDGGKSPGGRGGVFTDDLPHTTPMIPSEKPLKKEASKASKKKDKSKVQRQQTVEKKLPTSDSTQAPSRKAPSRNPCHLSLRRRNCVLSGPKHQHPELSHADIGHRMVCRLNLPTAQGKRSGRLLRTPRAAKLLPRRRARPAIPAVRW